MKRFFKTAYILILAAALSACTDFSLNSSVVSTGSTTTENETTANGKARLSVCIGEKSARTILPTDISESGITRAELLAKASGAASSSAVKEWTSDGSESAIAKMTTDTEILIGAGTYDFTLNLYAPFNDSETLCQTGTLSAVTVASGNNALTFATKYAVGSGNLALTLTWAAEQRVASVKAGLFSAESGGETAASGYEMATLMVSGDSVSGFSATYAKNDLASGTYFVRIELFSANGTKINTLEDVVKISTACTTSKTLPLSNVNTMYSVTYHLNGGEWADGFTPTETRNENKAVILPTENDITRTGYDFAGWYTAEDFADGTERTEITLGTAADVELWAKWELTSHATAETVVEIIKAQTASNTIYLSGIIDVSDSDSNTIRQINAALKELAQQDSSILITLDLSGVDNLSSFENASYSNKDYGFFQCENLSNLILPSDLKNIGSYTFKGCKNLTEIILPESLESLGSFAFDGCTSLTSINIPNGVTCIDVSTFSDCSSLMSVTIPDSVTSINYGAFSNCESLAEIEIPDSVTYIGPSAFVMCQSITSMIIPDGVTQIENQTFATCTSLTNIEIPNSVTKIGDKAFSSCRSLTSVTIPDSVTSIGNDAFYRCLSLESIVIPNNVTSIGDAAFFLLYKTYGSIYW